MTKKFNRYFLCNLMKSNTFVVIIFVLLSIVSGCYLLRSHIFGFTYDIYFHWQRIIDIKESIINGNLFSNVALNQFFQSGSAAMSMYPKINIIPMAFISIFIKGFFNVIYISFILRNLLGLIISYFSCLNFTKNKSISFLFSVSYTLSTTVLALSFQVTDIGMTSSLIYLPMILFGTFVLISDFKWKELSVGISAIILCHVITAVMSILLVLFFLFLNFRKLKNTKVIISLSKMICTVILLTSVFWIPFTQLITHNVIFMPHVNPDLSGVDINTWLLSSINNSVNRYMNVFSIIGIVLSVIRYKFLSKFSKQIFFSAILVLFIGSPFFPWVYLQHSFLVNTFQFTWRIYIIPQLLLTYLFAEQTINICIRKKHFHISLILITMVIVLIQAIGQKNVVNYGKLSPLNYKELSVIYRDYLPSKSIKNIDDVNNHLIYYDDKKSTVKLLGNGNFSFHLNKSSKILRMPFIIYNGINYQVKVDGKNANFYSDGYSQLTINNVNKGKHTVQVIVHKSWYDYLSYVLSSLGIVILLYSLIKEYCLKRKNE